MTRIRDGLDEAFGYFGFVRYNGDFYVNYEKDFCFRWSGLCLDYYDTDNISYITTMKVRPTFSYEMLDYINDNLLVKVEDVKKLIKTIICKNRMSKIEKDF